MLRKAIFVFFIVLFTCSGYCQTVNFENALREAVAHRQTQNAANVISWHTEHFLLNIDSFSIEQSKGQLTIQSGNYLVKYNIKILGTYNHKDSTFLWSAYNSSINKRLATPISNLISIAAANKWQIANNTMIKCSFDSAYKLATLAFYLDKANGINHILTNNRQTNMFFSFYEVEVYDRRTKRLVKKVLVKKQYEVVDAPALLEVCKNYVAEFDANEKKYYQLYKRHNDDWKYIDSMFINRVKISNKYWDTACVPYVLFRKNRLQAKNLLSIINWRVIEVANSRYVLYDERESWGSLKTWAFKMCWEKGENNICNEYLCF
ncbi:DUF6882 domain-containing protein [Segetibacter aerophilus]|nr:DUF6882 domain-containing protein [Segetibacter aerophilus]